MGRALAARYRAAEETFIEAEEMTGLDLRKLCWSGPAEELNLTQLAQPALLTVCVATWRVLARRGLTTTAAAGHSVGTFAALVAAGHLSFHDAVKLVQRRGELMAAVRGSGSMCAVVSSTGADAESDAETAGELDLELAAHNSPKQRVWSGSTRAVLELQRRVHPRGQLLAVSHAFHSRLMRPALADWSEAVSRTAFVASPVPVHLNGNGAPSTDIAAIRADLIAGLTSPVRWTEVMRQLPDGSDYLALGPAKALVALGRRADPPRHLQLLEMPV